MEFDPKKHVIQLKGKWYLETKYRVMWFREAHPRGFISTEVISNDPMMVKATIYDGEGSVLATGHATAVDKGTAVWSGRGLEKAETAAIGRALAHAGYGTQFAGADEVDGATGRRSGRDEGDTRRSAEPNSPPRRNWLANDGAKDAFVRRLRIEIHPSVTFERAEQLVRQALVTYPNSDAALKAVAQAYQAAIEDQPA